MGSQVTNYQCPACSGPLGFSSDSGELGCEYCGTTYEVSVIEELYADEEQAAIEAETDTEWELQMAGVLWDEEEAAQMKAYNCPSCGAQLICDVTTAATSCPYCSNPTVIPGQFVDDLKPDYVIPFKMNKEAAQKALKRHYKGKVLLPKAFKSENNIEEIKGVYVPFWLFDGVGNAHMVYRGTKVRSYRQGDTRVTITEYYHILRKGNAAFQKVPVDGSTKMPDAHMDAIEPYNYSEMVPFSTAYLPGYLADKYDVDADECSQRANTRIRTSIEKAVRSTVKGYASVMPQSSHVGIDQGDVKYALFPVWLLNTKWRGKDFLFAMNGQTGKFIGDLPIHWGKFFLIFGSISIPLMLIIGIILFFFVKGGI